MATRLGEHSYQHFHICWSPISLYLPWLTEAMWQGRCIMYSSLEVGKKRPWGSVCSCWAWCVYIFRWVEMWGTGEEITPPRSSSSQRNYLLVNVYIRWPPGVCEPPDSQTRWSRGQHCDLSDVGGPEIWMCKPQPVKCSVKYNSILQ